MSFFYNLNNKLNAIRELPSVTHGQLNERDMSRAAKGYEKYGKQGMEALAKAGREGKDLDKIRDKYNKYDESVAEGNYTKDAMELNPDFARVGRKPGIMGKMAQGVKRVADKIMPGDEDLLRDLERKTGGRRPTKVAEETGLNKAAAAASEIINNTDPYSTHIGSLGSNHVFFSGSSGSDEHTYHIYNDKTKETDTVSFYHEGNLQSLKDVVDSVYDFNIAKIIHGHHKDNLDESVNIDNLGESIDFDKVLDAIAALYGDDIWENDAMQDLANDLEQAGPTDRELDFIIAKGKLPKRLANTQFSAGDNVRFGEAAAPMSAKQKSFAALAEPKDKITFADKIAGAKKEVDEMLGDVAAEAMKSALSGGQKKLDKNNNGKLDANDFAMLRKGANKNQGGVDEASTDNAFTAHKRAAPAAKTAVGTVTRGSKHDVEEIPGGRRVTRRVDPAGISVGADDDKPADGEKRGRGRPKGPEKAPERVTGGATKHKGGRKTNEGENESDDIKQAMAMLKKAGYTVEKVAEQVDEKAVSKKQQRFMGMVSAAKQGEKPASMQVAKTAKNMKKGDAEDFASTKHKGLPEKTKKEKTEETADSTPSKGGVKFGGGIYDSMNRDLENMIAESMARLDESMSINMSMNNDDHGGPSKSLTVTATDDDAMKLSQLLKSAGLGGGDSEGYGGSGYQSACGCGSPDCGCDQQAMDEAYGDVATTENTPDYPTEAETSEDPFQYSGGINKPKATGQTTAPVIASQDRRQGMAEGSGYDGSEPLDLDTNPSVKDVFKRALYIYDYEGYGNDMDYSEDDAIEQYVARKFGQDVLDKLTTAKSQQYFGRADGKGPGGGGRTSNLGTSSAPGGNFRTTRAGKMYGQDVKTMKSRVADRLGRHPEPNLPEQNYAEAEQDALHRMMEMAGIKKKEVDEEKTDEGNLLTKGLADKNIKIGDKIPGTNVIKKKDIDESIFAATANLWATYKG